MILLIIIFGLLYLIFQFDISNSPMIQEFEIAKLKIRKCKTLIDLKEINYNLYSFFKHNGLNDSNIIISYCALVPQSYYLIATFEGFDNTGNTCRSEIYYYTSIFK